MLEINKHDKTELSRSVLASSIGGPVSLVADPLSPNIVYVTAYDSGQILQIDVNQPGSYSVILNYLREPEGIDVALSAEGQSTQLVVVEVGRQRLLMVDSLSSNMTVLATNLRVGTYGPESDYNPIAKPYLMSSVAVTNEGNYYISGDETNAIYFLERKNEHRGGKNT